MKKSIKIVSWTRELEVNENTTLAEIRDICSEMVNRCISVIDSETGRTIWTHECDYIATWNEENDRLEYDREETIEYHTKYMANAIKEDFGIDVTTNYEDKGLLPYRQTETVDGNLVRATDGFEIEWNTFKIVNCTADKYLRMHTDNQLSKLVDDFKDGDSNLYIAKDGSIYLVMFFEGEPLMMARARETVGLMMIEGDNFLYPHKN